MAGFTHICYGDTETRSPLNIKECGGNYYARSSMTRILNAHFIVREISTGIETKIDFIAGMENSYFREEFIEEAKRIGCDYVYDPDALSKLKSIMEAKSTMTLFHNGNGFD